MMAIKDAGQPGGRSWELSERHVRRLLLPKNI